MEKILPDFDPTTLFAYEPIVDRAAVRWPDKARIAVWIVPNIEHFHLEMGPGAPDVRNYARRDYGNRVGIWRLMETMQKYNVRGTVALNSEVCRYYPRIIEEAIRLKGNSWATVRPTRSCCRDWSGTRKTRSSARQDVSSRDWANG
jgi:hypothetical protein